MAASTCGPLHGRLGRSQSLMLGPQRVFPFVVLFLLAVARFGRVPVFQASFVVVAYRLMPETSQSSLSAGHSRLWGLLANAVGVGLGIGVWGPLECSQRSPARSDSGWVLF